jgi:GTP diphosphokinase / guanosine-3',5'-bis(diphosphate) 3'-diphosphatase
MNYFAPLAAKLKKRKDLDFDLIQEAYIFAHDAHHGQKRKSGEDYIMHPAAVAELVYDAGGDVESLIAALLHDTIEDTNVTAELVKNKFGKKVAYLVDSLTKLNRVSKSQKENVQYLRKIFFSMSGDLRVVIIKLLDHLHNMQTLAAMPPEKQLKKAKETFEVYVGLAERLNLWEIKKSLEDLCFQYLWEQDYRKLKKAVSEKQEMFSKEIQRVKKSIKLQLQKEFQKTILVTFDIHSLYEIFQKQGKLLKLADCYFINIILSSEPECYKALGIIHKYFRPRNYQLQDFLASPKENGYQAIHTTIFSNYGLIDIHIHTKESHQSMMYTDIFSWYKSSGKIKAHRYNWIQRLLQMNIELQDDAAFHSSVTKQVLAKNITVYSPEGEKYNLPVASTILDYLVLSSKKPLTYSSIQINEETASILDTLNQDDIIEISYSSKKQAIRYEWLESVKTHQAKIFINKEIGGSIKMSNLLIGLRIIEDWIPTLLLLPIQELRKIYEKNLLKKKKFLSFEEALIAMGEETLSLGEFLDTLIPMSQQMSFRSIYPDTYVFGIVVFSNHKEKFLSLGPVLNILFLTLNPFLPSKLYSKYSFRMNDNKLFINYYFTNFSQIVAIITKIHKTLGLSSHLIGKYNHFL